MKISNSDINDAAAKSNNQGKRYTVDLEVDIYDDRIKDQVIKFCKNQKINPTDEPSLLNYVLVIVEG